MSDRISLVINVDSRAPFNKFEGMRKGVRSRDFLRSGILNKKSFFKNVEVETIVHLDLHEDISDLDMKFLKDESDCLVVRKHSKFYRNANPFNGFNDVSYIQALSMCRSDWVCHMDGDMAAFSRDGSVIEWMMDEVDSGRTSFVSYPSESFPGPCHAPEYCGKWWVSTRFFFGKRESLDFTILERSIRDPQWFYSTYDRPPRENPWLEQMLGILVNYKVVYPRPDLSKWVVFPWMSYYDGLLEKLNSMSYDDVEAAIMRAGGTGIFHDGVDCNLLGV